MLLTDSDIEVNLLLEAIYSKYNYDFRNYARSSIKRRLVHAMMHFEMTSISSLQEKLFSDPDFFGQVLQFLTIPTSEMFRDPVFFLSLREKVVPILKTYPSLKVWVAGCAHGEELYTLAILFKEEGLLEKSIFYATDINPRNLSIAEKGIYPASQMEPFAANYVAAGGKGALSDYYSLAYDSAVMARDLRKNVVFADHSLATDSVFSEMHLILCRNVLIYFNRSLQNRALGLFYDSLCPRGFLGIGSKESLRFSDYKDKFSPVDEMWKLYRRNP